MLQHLEELAHTPDKVTRPSTNPRVGNMWPSRPCRGNIGTTSKTRADAKLRKF